MGSDDNTVSPKGEPPDPRFETAKCDNCGAMLPYENHLGGCSNDETTGMSDDRAGGRATGNPGNHTIDTTSSADGTSDTRGGFLAWLLGRGGDG